MLRATITEGQSPWRVEWELDLAKDSQVSRSVLYRDEKVFAESRTTLGQFGRRWYPKRVDYFRREYKDGLEPYRIIDVQEASFDEPSHRSEPFTPNDIGLALGHQIHGMKEFRYWDGVQLITKEEYDELVYLNGVDPDPVVVERQAKWTRQTPEEYLRWLDGGRGIVRARWEEQHGLPYIPYVAAEKGKDPWNLYVEKFLAEHELTDAGVKRAEQLLKKAKAVRAFHERKKGDELREAEKRHDKEKIEAFNKRKEQIFKEMLVRPLDELVKKAETTARR